MLEWQNHGACRGITLEHQDFAFFTKPYRGIEQFCSRCEVKAECLAFALKTEGTFGPQLRYGAWGGKTPRQRAVIAGCIREPQVIEGEVEHGTRAGYEQHRRRHESACDECREFLKVDRRRKAS